MKPDFKSLVLLCTVLVTVVRGIDHTRLGKGLKEKYDLPDIYTIVLKDDAWMSSTRHAEWATSVHLENQHRPGLDELNGLIETPTANSYLFSTYKDTIDIIGKHPDVLEIQPPPPPEPRPDEYVVTLNRSANGAKGHAAWAQSVHDESQKDSPNPRYKGILQDEILSNMQWCYTGSFSPETVEIIRTDPKVESIQKFYGILIY